LPVLADQQVPGIRFKDCANLMICLPTMILGVTALDNNLYLTKNALSSSTDRLPVQIFVNGRPTDFNYLNTMTGNDIETVEFFKTDGFSGINRSYQSDGIVSIITRKLETSKITFAQLQDMLPKGNLLTYNAQGYSVSREFYSPKYDLLKQGGGFGGDLRSTIYWAPKVKTDKTGITSIDFFNSDSKGTYRATIEGIDADGNLGRYVLRYTVK
jgi:hypothetical protein